MGEKDTGIWKRKLDWIVEKGGMALLDTHPDYMAFDGEKKGMGTFPVTYYREFLERFDARGHLSCVCGKEHQLTTRTVLTDPGALPASARLVSER
ncbi:MAG: hypothetical protein ACXU8O_05265, partial [Asticcacaulis sp.]